MNWKRWFSDRDSGFVRTVQDTTEEARYQNFRARLMDEMKIVNYRLIPIQPEDKPREGTPT